MFKIAIDAGHGLHTAGKRVDKKLDPAQTREWTLNDRIADKVENLLKNYTGYELLRVDDTTGKKDVSLGNRVKAANNFDADIYIAIHHNAGIKGGSGGGIVVYVCKNAQAASTEWQKELYNELIAATGLKGNRATPLGKENFEVIKKTKMPAVLLELGFMDSKTDAPIILSEKYADQCAATIVKVLVKRGGLKKKATTEQQETVKKDSVKVDSAKSYNALKAGKYIVNTNSLNLRSGASTNKQIIEAMPKGKTFTCYGYYTGFWLYGISASGKKGFCHKSYLKKK